MIVAVTGHRSEDAEAESVVREKFKSAFETFGATTVIVGMANGTDLWAGDVAILLGLEVWAAKPWTGHKPRAADRELYARVLEGAEHLVNVIDVENYPGAWVYHKRNEWMVDHCDELFAYWNGKKSGGTYACKTYAEKKGVPVRNLYA